MLLVTFYLKSYLSNLKQTIAKVVFDCDEFATSSNTAMLFNFKAVFKILTSEVIEVR